MKIASLLVLQFLGGKVMVAFVPRAFINQLIP